MKRPIILVLTLVIVIALVASLILLIDESKQPHVALISERTAEKFSGQNYTLSTLTTETGRTLSLAPYGNILVQGATYSNGSQSSKNESYYYFQVVVLEFNATSMAQTVYQMESGLFGSAITNSTGNGTYKGFHYIYTDTSMERNKTVYYWGATGYYGDLVFVIEGQSPWPPTANVSAVAIDQINAMTAFHSSCFI